ncbi:aminopeptidase N [Caulobacter sp. 17J80-11]|uniref:aminopeptidase N n=1 Tax=Caulobacter sp. 17J80-11 TaxID=2763502 RepID=UPI0016539ADD|nr:aminopeptidase N [Caulobacter sp. 17J80-11]MBC6980967.1 aminopeptidase N [Caulobacter sp. 17J80-11]
MRTDTPQPVRLADYRPTAYAADEVELTFRLHPTATRVLARLHLRRQEGQPGGTVFLNGERLKPISFAIDGEPLSDAGFTITDEGLTLHDVPDDFVLETEVEIDPQGNTALEGLYISGGRFCTQCEAEGFRKITWFLDRPDVLTRYTVRIEAETAAYPHLLSNGNLVERGEMDGGRHYAVWRDPFPKPCYLFALVAGQLDVLSDSFTTMSGRNIDLRVYVDPGQAERATYAMDALKRSMKWDEETYGREYDLDLFMIVAVRDFNFGAMENKGLNIFNSSLLLADPSTATDVDYERIESVVAHEYFHNWTGNRITCRDWFQLCVKEGLTVFRDQGFSADMRGAAVQRIKDVKALRARQFPEDQGPLAHPARPTTYFKIDNFYTATVYEKGSEIIRMLRTLLGPEDFRRGMDHYFEKFDGHAVTVEDFVGAFAETTGRDLSKFFRWYAQAGTPEVHLEVDYDPEAKAVDLRLTQTTPPTPGQPDKDCLPVPIKIGLLDEEGRPQSFMPPGADAPVQDYVLVLESADQTVRLTGVERPPVVSPGRGFSAPIVLSTDAPDEHRFVRLASDPDLFARWEAGQNLARDLILARAEGRADLEGEARYAAAVGRALADQSSNEAFKALLLSPPIEQDLSLCMSPADPAALHDARETLRATIATQLRAELERLHDGLTDPGPFSPDAAGAGRRSLRNGLLDLLASVGLPEDIERARAHYDASTNMTDAMGAMNALVQIGGLACETVLNDFYERWKDEPLVVDKWFAVQARTSAPDAIARVQKLASHPAFDAKNPNRLRALVQTFASGNPYRFHDPSGAGYRFLADQILAVDAFNPMTAARLVEPLGGWRRYRPELGALMRGELARILAHPGLSPNVRELASKALET